MDCFVASLLAMTSRYESAPRGANGARDQDAGNVRRNSEAHFRANTLRRMFARKRCGIRCAIPPYELYSTLRACVLRTSLNRQFEMFPNASSSPELTKCRSRSLKFSLLTIRPFSFVFFPNTNVKHCDFQLPMTGLRQNEIVEIFVRRIFHTFTPPPRSPRYASSSRRASPAPEPKTCRCSSSAP